MKREGSFSEGPQRVDPAEVRGVSRVCLGVGTFLLGVSALGSFWDPKQFVFSWHFAFSFYYTLCLGAFFWLLVHHATRSSWGTLLRRQLENVVALFPWVAVLFVPVFLDVWMGHNLYEWSDPAQVAKSFLWKARLAYLNPGFFSLRALGYLLFFVLASRYLCHQSLEQDRTGDPRVTLRLSSISCLLAPFFAGVTTFSAFDWWMSLEERWASTMWGVYLLALSLPAAMALWIGVILGLRARGYLGWVTQEHFHAMGKLLFAFIIFWAYIAFAQYFLVWYGNLPEETGFFIRRNHGSWQAVSVLLVYGNFGLTFVWLLTQGAKKDPRRLGIAAIWVVAMHVVEIYWIVMPVLHPEGPRVHWMDVTLWAGMGAVLVGFLLRTIAANPLYPLRDPLVEESVHLRN